MCEGRGGSSTTWALAASRESLVRVRKLLVCVEELLCAGRSEKVGRPT